MKKKLFDDWWSKIIANSQKLFAIAMVVAIGIMILLVDDTKEKTPPPENKVAEEVLWYTSFESKTSSLVVRIDESRSTDQPNGQRIVQISSAKNPFIWVTGCDLKMDGKWDKVFWNGYDEGRPGLNSYVRGANDEWTYVPCEGDAKSPPIPEAEIAVVIEQFNEAMDIRGRDNLVQLFLSENLPIPEVSPAGLNSRSL